DVIEIQQDFLAAELIDQAEELLADDLDVLLVQDFLVDEIDGRNVADVLDFEAFATRRLGHALTPRFSGSRLTAPDSTSIYDSPPAGGSAKMASRARKPLERRHELVICLIIALYRRVLSRIAVRRQPVVQVFLKMANAFQDIVGPVETAPFILAQA